MKRSWEEFSFLFEMIMIFFIIPSVSKVNFKFHLNREFYFLKNQAKASMVWQLIFCNLTFNRVIKQDGFSVKKTRGFQLMSFPSFMDSPNQS